MATFLTRSRAVLVVSLGPGTATLSAVTRSAVTLSAVILSALILSAATPGHAAGLPQDMMAVRMHGKGGPEALRVERVPLPQPAADQVLIRVRAAGVNPVDWKIRERGSRSGQPRILGFDAAGTIVSVGRDVKAWKAGDEVMALTSPSGGGAYAEYVVAYVRDIARKAQGMSFEEAAGVPTAGATVWTYLVLNAGDLKGKRILIHGGAGGVGSVAVQLAKARGAHVLATASGRNHEYLRSIGVDEPIDYTKTRFEDAARDVDIVFDTVGGETLQRSYAVVKRGGMLVSIVNAVSGQQCDTRAISCPSEASGSGAHEALDAIRELAEAGRLRINVDRVFPLEEAAQAQELNKAGHTRGKIVLRVGQ